MLDDKLKASKILIIDDDSAARALSRLALKKAGSTSIADTESPVAGLNKLAWGNFDLLLLDWQMPELKGIDVLRAVRRFNETIYIIMITSEDSREFVTEAIRAGTNDYIVKPWKPAELVTKVTDALVSKRKKARELDW